MNRRRTTDGQNCSLEPSVFDQVSHWTGRGRVLASYINLIIIKIRSYTLSCFVMSPYSDITKQESVKDLILIRLHLTCNCLLEAKEIETTCNYNLINHSCMVSSMNKRLGSLISFVKVKRVSRVHSLCASCSGKIWGILHNPQFSTSIVEITL